MVPLKNIKISLIHKDKKQNAFIDTKREVPQNALLSASFTIEAALVFPLFLFVMVGIMFFFRVLQIEHMTYGALAAAAGQISLEADETDEPFSRAEGYFYTQLAKKKFPFSFLVAGRGGIKWSNTNLEGEYVDLWIQYDCKMPIRILGFQNIPITQRVKMKKWIGNSGSGQEQAENQWVYITPNGTVYHLTKECTHLRLSIHIMEKSKAQQAGYEACILCKNDKTGYGYYYVTDEGEKYHTKLSCSGLKRTIYMVRLSQTAGKRSCARCGGGG